MGRTPKRSVRVLAAVGWLLAAGVVVGAQESQGGAPSDAVLNAAVKAADDLPRLRSLLVSRRGELILERYFHGAQRTRLANIKSASKSMISALVGIAIERGLIAGVEEPIAAHFPELLRTSADLPKQAITIEDLLTMRSGLESTSGRNYGAWVQSANWVRYILSRPLRSPPGIRMDYSTGDFHLLSAILTKVSGSSTWEFARDTLAEPLGITLARWPQDPQGIYFGGNDMQMTPRQMVAFGELYLNRGRANGRQVVPAAWVGESFIPRTRSRWSEQLYGYGWWMREMAGRQTYFAWGYGGQFILVVRDLELVLVTTSSTAVGDARRRHTRAVYDLMENLVIEPLSAAAGFNSEGRTVD